MVDKNVNFCHINMCYTFYMNFYKNTLIFLTILGFFSVPYYVYADFYRSLSLGDEGEDVLVLQKVLNRDPETKIASIGIGSSGNESRYFGELTKQAVIRFQNKYKNEILTPNGLVLGTGYVGPSTLSKLSQLMIAGSSNIVGEVNPNPVNTLNIPPPPPLLKIEDDDNKKSSNSTVSTDSKTAQQLAGSSEPKMSNLTKISSISPSSGGTRTRITIKGIGFSKDSNDVFAGMSFIKGVKSADGTTLVVDVQNPFEDNDYASSVSGKDLAVPIGIYVKNSSGVSNAKVFTLEF